nr:hypothetical protein [Promineifilum sp.]
MMTWWAVSLTLLSHDFGNEVLGRETLLTLVPIFVAALVLLTRILFIGAFSVAGEHLFDIAGEGEADVVAAQPQPARQKPVTAPQPALTQRRAPQITPVDDDEVVVPIAERRHPTGRPHTRPTMPSNSGIHHVPAPMAAKPRSK